MMSYNPVSDTDNTRRAISQSNKIETCSGSDTEIETAQFDVDESTSFLGQKLEDRARHSGRATPPQGGLSTITPLVVTLIPWVINFILMIALVSLSWKTVDSRMSTSHQPPTDLMYSELASGRYTGHGPFIQSYQVDTLQSQRLPPTRSNTGWKPPTRA